MNAASEFNEAQEKLKAMRRLRSYEQGFHDGMSMSNKSPTTFQFLGYSMDQLVKIIREHEEREFCAGEQWTVSETALMKDQAKINARQKREEFRAALATLNASEIYQSSIMRAYDKVHGIEAFEKPCFEIYDKDTDTDIVIYASGRVEGMKGEVRNRIPELIAEAIAKANQK